MPNAKQNLVIVESPSKAKTIGKYLGPDYQVKASMGHLRDLPKSTLSVDIEHDFEPEYQPLKGKEEIIADLRKAAKGSGRIYLATDPDREGEAISWHLKYLLNIPDDETYRVTFNEITRNVVQESIRHPRPIDQNLVDAQQARRVLDRIVGYQLSPLLWKKIRKGLSAGRVQSVATRLVVDRENEIRAFVPQEYWTLDVNLNRVGKSGSFTAHYYGDPQKRELSSEQDVQSVLDALEGHPFSVTGVKKSEKKRTPAPPFITSTLQQEASRKLNMTPRRTMMIAQQLYEGVEISGEGSVGLITYMRTDSLRISEEALAAAGDDNAVLLDVKSPLGNFYYSTDIADAQTADADIAACDALIKELTETPDLIVIARVPAFSDPNFVAKHYSSALTTTSGDLWMDERRCYWLRPDSLDARSYLAAIALELDARGFDEVLFDNFTVPDDSSIAWDAEAITQVAASEDCAETLGANLTGSSIRLALGTTVPSVAQYASRVYITTEKANDVMTVTEDMAEVLPDPSTQLVFITTSHDTRFDASGVIRPLLGGDGGD